MDAGLHDLFDQRNLSRRLFILLWSFMFNIVANGLLSFVTDLPDIGLRNISRCNVDTELECDEGLCILKSLVCDGVPDCRDGKDEPNSCAIIARRPCTIVEFRCHNHKCIPLQYICNGQNDCRDSSDELMADCTNPCRIPQEFHCPANPKGSSCFASDKRCDGVLNCLDGRDEVGCGHDLTNITTHCLTDQFQCPDGKCLSRQSLCNHFVDCLDGSDELHCGCDNATEMECKDKSRCIYREWLCDGTKDCPDNSDETDCRDVHASTCHYPHRPCGGGEGKMDDDDAQQCMMISRFCDGVKDCRNGLDEGTLCDQKRCLGQPCINGTCRSLPDGTFSCLCSDGFTLDMDGRTCIKIDPCKSSWGVCSQECINMPKDLSKGFRCDCLAGFKLAKDKFTCHSMDNRSAFLIFSSRHEIRMIDLGTPDIQPILVPSLRNTIAIDFLYDAGENGRQLIFWSDVVDDKIYSGFLVDAAVFDVKQVVENSLPTAEGIAVDWIGHNLYWVESTLDQIEVARVDGQNRATIIAGNMTNPRAIVLDPQEGLLFWTDWDPYYPRIESASMAGQDRRVLVNISAIHGGKWPNGLAIDYEASPHRLYWIDAHSDAIHAVAIDGQDVREVARGGDYLQHPFALAVFGSYVYWTDWRTNSVHRANKWNGSNITTVTQVSTQPFDVHIVHSSLQPKVRNPCGIRNGDCSHLCLIGLNGTSVCQCPHLMQFVTGSHTQCQPFRTFLLFSRTTEIRGVTLENSQHNFMPAIINVQNVTNMDIDVAKDQIYWVDIESRTVVRSCLNGSHRETVVDSPGGPRPTDVAIDWISRTIFTSFAMDGTRASKGEISVSTLSGEFRKTLLSDKIISPVSIAVSPLLGKIVWADIGHAKHRLEMASANGLDRVVLADDSSSRDFRGPSSLTFGSDLYQQHIFWISEIHAKILFCQLKNDRLRPCPVIESISSPFVTTPLAIAYYQQSLFIAVERPDPSIGLLNLGNGSFDVVRARTSSVVSVKMFGQSVQEGIKSCSSRNGNCSQLCLPNSGTTRTCNCTAGYLLDPRDETVCVPLNSTLLYSIGAQIHGIALDPTQSDELLPRISRISMATALDFEAESSSIYWVDPKTSTLNRIRRDLTGRHVIVEDDISSVDSIAVDWMAGNLYWTNPIGRTIEVSRLNGSSRFVVLHDNLQLPKAIAVHPAKGLLFWSDISMTSPKIERAALDGSSRITLGGVQRVTDITIDYEENQIYWCDSGLDRIERANLDFTGRTVLFTNATYVMDPASIVVFLNYVYWTDRFPQKGIIYRADKADLRRPTVIRKGLNATVNDVVVFSRERQKGTNLCSINNGGCEELCFFTGKTRTCACAHGILSTDAVSCDAHTSFLLYSRGRSIESAHLLTETNKNDPISKLQNNSAMVNVIGLAFDFDTSRIFYSDIQKGQLYSVLFNATQWKIIASGVGSAEGLAFDPHKQDLYWTSYNNASIFRIFAGVTASNQTPHRVVQLTVGDKLRNLAVDACKQKLYWTNWNKDLPSIQRVGYDGQDLESIITTDIKTPNAIAIDHRSQYLFWADALMDKIERARLDGSERKILLMDSVRHPFGLTVYGDHLYWTDWIMRAVVGVNKYTGLDVVKIRENLGRQPMGIVAVSATSQDCRLNPCFTLNGGCREMCYPSVDGSKAMCQCFNNRTLLTDGVSCEVGNGTCGMGQFRCATGKCIPLMLTCDLRNHCDDGSDEEKDYCLNRTCPVGFISCKASRKCVPESLRCNRRDDCGDGTDEVACVCDDSEFRCKSTGDCIKTEYRCDGEQDCGDSSDEIGCHGRKCETTPDGRQMLPCPNSAMCYLPEWLCDGDNDCGDMSDESNCSSGVVATTALPCSKDLFRCANGASCIPSSWKCDAESDCSDNSDESDCSAKCPADSFECSDGSCIPAMWKCDGVPECSDGSDETFDLCHKSNCSATDFRCAHSGLCVPGDWRCDGEVDCGRNDSSDETEGCDAISRCSFNEFRCLNNRCIPGEFICDSEDDCGDWSDEMKDMCGDRNATHESNTTPTDNISCLPPAYHCKNGLLCINESLTCDNKDDCGDLSDEIFCDLNDCLANPCGPHGNCLEKRIGYECSCNAGYVVSNKTGECVDFNECDNFPCSHFCYNTVGSYRCVCSNGYLPMDSGRSCKAISDTQPTLLYSNKHFIRNVSFKGDLRSLVRGNLTNAVALDFEWTSQCLFWSDVTPSSSSINRWCLKDAVDHIHVLQSATVHNPDGIAVDWIAGNLYWCDKGTDTIEVSKLDGGSRKILLKEGLQEPRALVVDPHHGYLYWSDWGHMAHIGKMGMDGSNIYRLQLDRSELGWPNALTIDYVTNTLFWADARYDYIAMADLNLQHRRRVLANSASRPDQLRHVFAMSVFEDCLFWTDWETKQIHRANKFSGANMTSMEASSHRPMDIQVFHPFRQMPLSFQPSPCRTNHGCSHLCLLKPTNNTKIPVTGICACPDNYILDSTGKTCLANCSTAHFVCEHTFKCIPKWWRCDGQNDCGDGFDEPDNCGRNFSCTPGEFQCTKSYQCLHPTNICDGIRQCSDGTDEDGSIVDCSTYLCLASQFKCPQSHHCIPRSHVCDGRADCKNGEDEKSCQAIGGTTAKKCTTLQYECRDGSCVSQSKVCDGKGDCPDGTDEGPTLNCTVQPCGRPDMFRCAGDGSCISDSRRCDGVNDCLDGSDESLTSCGDGAGDTAAACDPTLYFNCNDTKKCVALKWVCDDEDDCADGSDEKNCSVPCGPTQFSCDGTCMDLKFQCDGEHDCRDLSDETNCTHFCPDGHFPCGDESGCISDKWKCDGVIDCPDGSDESSCDHNCGQDEHTCKNKKCIVKQWLCDGDDDCGDKSDEDTDLCSRFPCFPDRFRCNSGICILQAQKCDGQKDCQDGSDETSCPNLVQVCRFQCANGRCLSNLKEVCDGINNCGDNSDEDACRLNPCTRYGHCSQRCLWDGDINNFTCNCDVGFRNVLHGKNRTCLADGAPAFLLLAEQNQLRSLDPYHRRGEYKQLMELKDERIAFVDVDMSNPQDPVLYWSSRENHVIYKQSLPKKRKERADFDRNEPHPLITNVQDPRGVAVDWVNDRLFWIDGHTKQIDMAFLNGTSRTPIISHGLSEPFDLVVDPESGYIIWSDISGNPRIERARFDGSQREVLIGDNIRYPTGLAIDYANRRVYWADPKTGYIETMTLEGKDRRRVRHPALEKEKPYNVDVFEDQLFVSTSKNNTVFRLNKFGFGNSTVLAKGLRRPATILIVQEKKQNKQLPAVCSFNTCPNGMLCIPLPLSSHRCICAGYATYNDVTMKCETPADTSCKPPCQNGGKCLAYSIGTGYHCRCTPQFMGPTCANPRCSSFCYNNGRCTFNGTIPKCTCDPPFTGDRCQQNMCTTLRYCENAGNCSVDAKGSLICSCPTEWVGKRCDIPRHECTEYCRNSGSCYMEDGKPHCSCLAGFSGERCLKGEGECGRCHNHGICYVDKDDSERCRCTPEFKGDNCEECDNLQCSNNGVCVKTNGKTRCNCSSGYSGPKCQKDLCLGFCKAGTCVRAHPPKCRCPPGKSGERCQIELECPCRNNGTCAPLVKVDGVEERRCKCVGNFYGKLCEFVPNCDALSCLNGGKCVVDSQYKFRCQCPPEYSGSRCESRVLCHNFCQNGATCLPPMTTYGEPTCICPTEFMGVRCESQVSQVEPPVREEDDMTPAETAVTIGIPILIILILTLAGVIAYLMRRRSRAKPFQHILMEEVGGDNNDVAISNPMFLKDESGLDEEDVLHPDKVAFANPIYESCFYSHTARGGGRKSGDTEKTGLLQLQEEDLESLRSSHVPTIHVTSSVNNDKHVKV